MVVLRLRAEAVDQTWCQPARSWLPEEAHCSNLLEASAGSRASFWSSKTFSIAVRASRLQDNFLQAVATVGQSEEADRPPANDRNRVFPVRTEAPAFLARYA